MIAGKTLHCTIQEAIDRAAPGDVVRVPAGRFEESAVISTALTLEGAGTTTILAPPVSPGISISAANVAVRSLVIESGAGVGIDVLQQGVIEEVELRGTSADGVLVRGTGLATLIGVRIIGMGARVEPGGTASLGGTSIENAPESGLFVDDGATVVVEASSRVTGSIGPGIVVFAADFEMRDSQSLDNGPVGSDIEDGLWLAAPTRSVIERSSFSNNRGYGIFCSAGVVPTVCTGNVFMGNQLGNTNCTGCN
jgi:nitrous oxidase accessory protein NosD